MSAPADLSGKLGIYRSTVWSTSVDLVVTDHRRVVAAANELHAILSRVEGVASRFLLDSEVNRLQHDARSGEPVRVSPELLELVQVALRAARLSDGAVDPTVGNAMCRIGYDRDFSSVRGGVDGDLPEPGPVPGWRSVAVDTEQATVAMPAGTSLDLGATRESLGCRSCCTLDRRAPRLRSSGLDRRGRRSGRRGPLGRFRCGDRRRVRRSAFVAHRGR